LLLILLDNFLLVTTALLLGSACVKDLKIFADVSSPATQRAEKGRDESDASCKPKNPLTASCQADNLEKTPVVLGADTTSKAKGKQQHKASSSRSQAEANQKASKSKNKSQAEGTQNQQQGRR